MQHTNTSTDIQAPRTPRLIRLAAVIAMTGIAKTTIYRDMRRGDFPRPCKAGAATLWIESEVHDWIAARVAERVAA